MVVSRIYFPPGLNYYALIKIGMVVTCMGSATFCNKNGVCKYIFEIKEKQKKTSYQMEYDNKMSALN